MPTRIELNRALARVDLNAQQRANLMDLHGYILRDLLTIEQVLEVRDTHVNVLMNGNIQYYIIQERITPLQIIGLDDTTLDNLTAFVNYITHITLRRQLAGNLQEENPLDEEDIDEVINDIILGNLNFLAERWARNFLDNNNRLHHRRINNQFVDNGFINGFFDQDLVNENIENDNEEPDEEDEDERLNNGQSTHTTSVHQSVSESVMRLMTRYGHEIENEQLETTIQRIQEYVMNLPDSHQNNAAKRCIQRITDHNYTFTEPASQISTRQLIALGFIAIEDEDNRIGSLDNARSQFIEGLYEIQRGYNLSASGSDTHMYMPDSPICSAGTFNKIVEKLQTVHKEVEIIFITNATASLKLPIVVQEEALGYLASLANPKTTQELLEFTHLIDQIKSEGIEVIWEQIKDNVTERMYDEFSSLYRDKFDNAFTGLIDCAQYVEVENLDAFINQAQQSRGRSNTFFRSQSIEEAEIEKNSELEEKEDFQENSLKK